MLNGAGHFIWGDEKIIKLGGGDGFTTLSMHMMSLNCRV